MLRIFLTGDNHIGLKYANHEQKDILISRRISAFDNMIESANREGCDLFVISGDLFENTCSISRKDVTDIMDKLANFHGTVAIMPGNHDYYDPKEKLWQYLENAIKSHDKIMLLKEYKPYEISVGDEKVVLYPALCKSKHSESGENNLGWIKETEIGQDGAYHIGIAHGAVEGETIDSEGKYFLMKRSELESIPVDAWLIGHTHVPFPNYLSEDYTVVREKIFNAGTHVQTDVNCNTEGLCFIIDIDSSKTIRAKKVVTGNLRFYRKEIALTAGSMEEILNRELSGIDDDSVVDITLTGAVSEKEYEGRHSIIERALNRFIESTCDDYALSRLISKGLIESEFPETSLSAQLLESLLDNPKEAQLAYEMLTALKKEGK